MAIIKTVGMNPDNSLLKHPPCFQLEGTTLTALVLLNEDNNKALSDAQKIYNEACGSIVNNHLTVSSNLVAKLIEEIHPQQSQTTQQQGQLAVMQLYNDFCQKHDPGFQRTRVLDQGVLEVVHSPQFLQDVASLPHFGKIFENHKKEIDVRIDFQTKQFRQGLKASFQQYNQAYTSFLLGQCTQLVDSLTKENLDEGGAVYLQPFDPTKGAINFDTLFKREFFPNLHNEPLTSEEVNSPFEWAEDKNLQVALFKYQFLRGMRDAIDQANAVGLQAIYENIEFLADPNNSEIVEPLVREMAEELIQLIETKQFDGESYKALSALYHLFTIEQANKIGERVARYLGQIEATVKSLNSNNAKVDPNVDPNNYRIPQKGTSPVLTHIGTDLRAIASHIVEILNLCNTPIIDKKLYTLAKNHVAFLSLQND